MAILTPVVTPAHSTTGVQFGISPTAIFPEAIDTGSILTTSCFLVATGHEDSFSSLLIPPTSIQDIVTAVVTAERWDLVLDQAVTTADYGDPIDPNRGELYRTKVTINPDNPLNENTNYVAILSRDITKTTVFDAEHTVGAGTGGVLTKGVYTKTFEDYYTIVITNTGVSNTAKYTWTRASDGLTSTIQEAKERFIEIDQGVKIKFSDGNFVAGNTYRIRVVPADFLNDYFAWSFSTGATDWELPEDENSNELVNLPATGGGFTGGPTVTSPTFYITKITPNTAESLIPIKHKAFVQLQDVLFVAKDYGKDFNYWTVNYVSGGMAGAEIVTLVAQDIEISMEDGVSTAQQIVDAFNASGLVNTNFTASTGSGTIQQSATDSKAYFGKGADKIIITVEFNKDINPATVTQDHIKLIAESLVPGIATEELRFDFSVAGNVLTITPLED